MEVEDDSLCHNNLKQSLNQSSLIDTLTLNDSIQRENIPFILKRVKSRSEFKSFLAHSLGIFHKYPLLLIVLEIILGLILVFLPIYLIIYSNLFNANIIISFFIITSFSFIYSLSLIIIRIVDDKKHNLFSLVKWQRNNIVKNFGLCIILLIVILAEYFLFKLYKEIKYEYDCYIGNYNNNMPLFNKLINDLYNYTFNSHTNIYNLNRTYINNNSDINNLAEVITNNLFYASIPLLLLSFSKIIKIILIKLKYSIEQLIFYINISFFCILNIILYSFAIVHTIIDIIQLICISLLLIVYDIWIVHSSIIKIINKNDKGFGIRNYNKKQLFIILLFDFLIFSGTSLIFFGYALYYIFGNEKIEFIKYFFEIGFGLDSLGFSYYYGHHIMKMLFKPISFEFVPSEIKNENYLKVKINKKFMEIMMIKYFKSNIKGKYKIKKII